MDKLPQTLCQPGMACNLLSFPRRPPAPHDGTPMMYHAYQAHADLCSPWLMLAQGVQAAVQHNRATHRPLWRKIEAACEVAQRARLTHRRPAFGIPQVVLEGQPVEVVEEAVHATAFGTLLRFRKAGIEGQPRVLLVAPLSGHFATLLRETVRTLLVDHDVYITDWHNARDVPLWMGRFGLEDYTAHLIEFLDVMGPGSHLVAICQPCVSALAATAIMAEDDHPAQPRTLTLMAGPVDCRINPTQVNALATSQPIEWFETRLISTVPLPHRGAGRRVYPGFVQVGAFLQMNLDRHIQSFVGLYNSLIEGDEAKAEVTKAFYEEYFAVLDLTAEFYLETVQQVFQEYRLPRGEMLWRGRTVQPAAIRRTALLTVEGERDDICAVGQTLAAHDLCSSIRPYMKTHHVQADAGHYGVFSGRRWNTQIYPLVREHIHRYAVA
jgi:poly(3-hydroxybutyrate) depolymerase